MNGDGLVILGTLVAYNLTLVGVGVWASRKSRAIDGFLIGGRGLGAWVAGLSYAATSSSAWVLLGFSGFVYSKGLSALWMLPGVWGGYVLAWVVLGRRLRREAAERSHVTMTDFLVGDVDGAPRIAIRWLSAAMILFCFIFYIAAQLQAAGGAMAAYFPFDTPAAIVFAAVMIGVYSLLGGFWAVSVTDTIQGLAMLSIALLAPAAAVAAAGGPAEIVRVLSAEAPLHLTPFGEQAGLIGVGAAIGAAAIGLGTVGQPQLLARVMAVRGDDERRKAFLIGIVWAVVVFSCMAILGLAGRALSLGLSNPEDLLFTTVDRLFPAIVSGLALAALLSAIMSTVDSLLIASAASVAHDVGVSRLAPRHTVLVARIVMALLCALAVWLAIAAPAAIFGRVLFAWSALGAAFGPIIVARVVGWRPAAPGVLLAMLIGFGLTVGFNQFWPSGPGQINERLVPWIPALMILFAFRRRSAAP